MVVRIMNISMSSNIPDSAFQPEFISLDCIEVVDVRASKFGAP
jgi:hypothetical protein